MKCLECSVKYIEQPGRAFHTRFKEHIQAIRNNNSNLGYTRYILNIGHKYGTITDTMNVTRTHRKGKHLYTLEKYHIYMISKYNLQMNGTHITQYSEHCRK
jgi:hypothetical protein